MAGLAQLARAGISAKSVDNLTPPEQLERINDACAELLGAQQAQWGKLRALLASEGGIDIVTPDDLDASDVEYVDGVFDREMWPQLTPQSVDPAHPFPFIANRGMGLMMTLQRIPGAGGGARSRQRKTGRWRSEQQAYDSEEDKATASSDMKAIVLIPPSLPRFVRLPQRRPSTPPAGNEGAVAPAGSPASGRASAAQMRSSRAPDGADGVYADRLRFLLVEDVISMKMEALFPDFAVKESGMFRVLRDSEVEVEEEAADLVRLYESALKKRRKGVVIHLAVDAAMPADLRTFLSEKLRVGQPFITSTHGLVGLSDVKQVITDDRGRLQFPPFEPRFPERIAQFGGDVFAAIRAKDFVVHHPFESFDVVVQFLRAAARDPDVISVKQTLYRVGPSSPIVRALIEAAESGKTVTALIELKARFDEEANIRWAKDLERAGVQVVYGFVELKTHAKVALVMRRESDGLRPYVHFGTGNYHPGTARVYTDISFFTADSALCRDANRLFNFMTSLRKPYDLERLAVAPVSLRGALESHIRDEIDNARAGFPAGIWAKMNALVDPSLIDLLYTASEAGVNITLIVRGICALRPGVPGLSSRITVKSIVGRFLEHSRVTAFGNKHALPSTHALLYMSSADWMTRNLDWRVEALVPLENPTVHAQVLDQVLAKSVEDVANSWILGSDGEYRRVQVEDGPSTDGLGSAIEVHTGAQRPAWGGDAHEYFLSTESLSGRGKATHPHGRERDWDNRARASSGGSTTATISSDGSTGSGDESDSSMGGPGKPTHAKRPPSYDDDM